MRLVMWRAWMGAVLAVMGVLAFGVRMAHASGEVVVAGQDRPQLVTQPDAQDADADNDPLPQGVVGRVWLQMELVDSAVADTAVPALRGARLDVSASKPTDMEQRVVGSCWRKPSPDAQGQWGCSLDASSVDVAIWKEGDQWHVSGFIQVYGQGDDKGNVPFDAVMSMGQTSDVKLLAHGASLRMRLSLSAITD